MKVEKLKYDLDSYERVNKCETLKELAKVILDLSNYGIIEGRIKSFDGVRMSNYCERLNKDSEFRVLTRMYGIRQQAAMIVYTY